MTRPLTSEVRKAIPDRVKVPALERALRIAWGIPADTPIQYDHRPPLALRPWVAELGDYDPPQLDPDSIFPVTRDTHQARTTGRRGLKLASSYGSDVHAIAKADRLEKDRLEREQFVRQVLSIDKSRPRSSRWPKRKFPKREKR